MHSRPVFPSVFLSVDAVRADTRKLMGRQSAGTGFLRGLSQAYAGDSRALTLIHGGGASQPVLEQEVRRAGWRGAIAHRSSRQPASWTDSPVLYYPAPIDVHLAWQRSRAGSASLALCGVTHTICSCGVQAQIAGYVSGPVAPWDALVCTSRSVRIAVERLWDLERERLARRLGLPQVRPAMPLAPVIPLGVHVRDFDAAPSARAQARRRWGVAEDEVLVLFVGRLSLHAKANPLPMYLACARAAARTGKTLRVMECGWFANDLIREAFDQGARLAGITVTRVDGREPGVTQGAYAAADIFMSLSDNIQETFGLTPVEAMAAGLPVIASDWDGYRETVRHGQDGFLIPTLQPADPNCAQGPSEAYEDGRLSYDQYIAHAHLMASVDIPATVNALVALVTQPGLRQAMGASGRQRARDMFDWRIVMAQYKELWAEQSALREAAWRTGGGAAAAGGRVDVGVERDPAFANPLRVFSHYATAALTADHRLYGCAPADVSPTSLRTLAMWDFARGYLSDAGELAAAVSALPPGAQDAPTVREWSARMRWPVAKGLRTAVWLHKMGLVRASA